MPLRMAFETVTAGIAVHTRGGGSGVEWSLTSFRFRVCKVSTRSPNLWHNDGGRFARCARQNWRCMNCALKKMQGAMYACMSCRCTYLHVYV